MTTTIQLKKDVLESLKKMKDHPRQSYDELIRNMIRVYEDVKKRNQYGEFLHKIQQMKMRELWDNEEDEEWEKVKF